MSTLLLILNKTKAIYQKQNEISISLNYRESTKNLKSPIIQGLKNILRFQGGVPLE